MPSSRRPGVIGPSTIRAWQLSSGGVVAFLATITRKQLGVRATAGIQHGGDPATSRRRRAFTHHNHRCHRHHNDAQRRVASAVTNCSHPLSSNLARFVRENTSGVESSIVQLITPLASPFECCLFSENNKKDSVSVQFFLN